LKDVLSDIVPAEQKRVAQFRKEYGATPIGQVTVDMVSKQLILETKILKI
jgi:hypothetical protein